MTAIAPSGGFRPETNGTRKAVFGAGGLAALVSLATANPVLLAFAILVLAGLFGLLWRPNEPPVLLFILSFQWLQAATPLVQASLMGEDVSVLSAGQDAIATAIVLSLLGLLALALGMRLAVRAAGAQAGDFKRILAKLSLRHAALLYFAASGLSFSLLAPLAFGIPALTQPLLAVADLKWFFFYIFACAVLVQGKGKTLLACAVLLEAGIGFTGFFSEFKQVFFVLILAILTVQPRMSVRSIALTGMAAAAGLLLALVWTAVKPQYREYLSGGTGLQVITRGLPERMETLAGMILDLDADALSAAAGALAGRVAYVDLFAHALLFVPSTVDHTEGELWGAALSHIAVPRAFFPDKPPLPRDSEIAARFTGAVTVLEGTSISIGYMAETYVDFGVPVMFGPLLGLGVLMGLLYASILRQPQSPLAVFPAAVTVLMGAFDLGMALPKLLGTVLMAYIVLRLWLHLGMPHAGRVLLGRAA